MPYGFISIHLHYKFNNKYDCNKDKPLKSNIYDYI